MCRFLTLLMFTLAVCPGFAANPKESARASRLDPDLARFFAEKRDLAKDLAERHDLAAPKAVWSYFDAAINGDWKATTNLFATLSAASGRYGGAAVVPAEIWPPIHETFGAYEQFRTSNHDLLKRFASEIIQSIPEGSVYFGGTDPGRFVISAMTRHTEGRPFYTLTQNALVDGNYLAYLTEIYGRKLKTLGSNDSQITFTNYVADAQLRQKEKRLKPGEDVQVIDGRVHVSGAVAVMAINEQLVQRFMQHNPNKEIFMEESYAMETLYPQTVPHGLILKIHHQPLERLPTALVQKDRQYWSDLCHQLVGNRLEMDTQALATWAEQRYTKREPAGNVHYTGKEPAVHAFAKCRTAIASVYAWRGKSESEKELLEEAESAHKQAWGLAPVNAEVAWRYSDFLLDCKRTNDAKIVLQTTLKMIPQLNINPDTQQGVESLEKLKAKEKALR